MYIQYVIDSHLKRNVNIIIIAIQFVYYIIIQIETWIIWHFKIQILKCQELIDLNNINKKF